MLSKTGSYRTNPNGTTTSYDKEKQARSKQIPQVKQPNTTATAEKLELDTGEKVVTDSNFLPHKQPKQIQKKY